LENVLTESEALFMHMCLFIGSRRQGLPNSQTCVI